MAGGYDSAARNSARFKTVLPDSARGRRAEHRRWRPFTHARL